MGRCPAAEVGPIQDDFPTPVFPNMKATVPVGPFWFKQPFSSRPPAEGCSCLNLDLREGLFLGISGISRPCLSEDKVGLGAWALSRGRTTCLEPSFQARVTGGTYITWLCLAVLPVHSLARSCAMAEAVLAPPPHACRAAAINFVAKFVLDAFGYPARICRTRASW